MSCFSFSWWGQCLPLGNFNLVGVSAPLLPASYAYVFTGKGPWRKIKSIQLPATLAHVVKVWKSKKDRGDEMLLYWKEDEEDVDDDEPYCVV